jgi:imidazolonepropionase-like amidohydrolase
MKIPPFIDAHMHFVVDGRLVQPNKLTRIMHEFVKCGIFSVNDMGYKTGIGLEAKRLAETAKLLLKIKSAGHAIYRTGTYGVFIGKGVSGIEEIRKAVKYIADSGADFIKVVNSGIVCFKGAVHITPGGFSLDELNAICDKARERNLEVACHVNGDTAIRNAVTAGVTSIEHGYFIANETLHSMKEKNISWTPTVFALLSHASELSLSDRRHMEKIIDNHTKSINYAASIGMKLNIGTDSGSKGVKHGESFFEELRLFQKAGLSLEQVLSAACMSKDEIAKGNFLVAEKDFINTGKIEAVFSGGRQIFFRQLF